MHTFLVLTLIGEDRPGIVEQLATVVSEHDGNWEASRMARLSGRFAGILDVSVAPERREGLEGALRALEKRGLKVVIEQAERTPDQPEEHRSLHLELVGHDRPGIIREISHTLAENGVNVLELTTECSSAPMAGGVLFRMTAELSSPPEVSTDDLRRTLEAVGDDLMVEVRLM